MLRELSALQILASRCVDLARAAGAKHAHVDATLHHEVGVKVRDRRLDVVQNSSGQHFRLSVVAHRRAAAVETNVISTSDLPGLVTAALELAELAETEVEPPVPPRSELAGHPLPNLSLWDDDSLYLDVREATRRALEAERAARDHDPRVQWVEASCGRKLTGIVLATTNGFVGSYATSYLALMVEAVCNDTARAVSRHFSAARFLAQLDEPVTVGATAARRAIRQLATTRAPFGPAGTVEMPVVFHPDAGRELIALIAAAVSGDAARRRDTYLHDAVDAQVASPLLSVFDDALVPRAMGSRPFDAEGLRSRSVQLIDRGILRRYLCTLAAARALGQLPTASSVRGPHGTAERSSNLVVLPGSTPSAGQIAGVESGLHITQLMGTRFSPSTGTVSMAASGFAIERGEIARHVSRTSITTTLDAVLRGIDAVGDDVDFRTPIACPTFRVAGLRIARS